MITELTIRNFKSISEQTYSFTDFDLIVGRNNSGKSTILQAMAIWQYCCDEFHRMKRTGKSGAQIVLPNFTPLPLPEFNLLWNNKIDRKYQNGSKSQEYVLIDIIVKYTKPHNQFGEFGVQLRYQTPQSIYAIPQNGWTEFNKLDTAKELPRIVYVPPFSGLDPFEKWLDDAVVRQNVGKGQPGSVLRNLLYRVVDKTEKLNDKETPLSPKKNDNWLVIQKKIKEWFDVTLLPPQYEKGISINIEAKYEREKGKEFDIISGGSGFHQALTLLAFYYGYEGVTTILFDEPDAHMHVNLQRDILNYFQQLKTTQFIIATHAQEFITGVSPQNIISVLAQHPERIKTTPEIITALSDVDNMAIVNVQQSPFILYVEGEDDQRILNGWAATLGREATLKKFHIEKMGGTTKERMTELADKHFRGLKKVVPEVKRAILLDYDNEDSYHPDAHNPTLFEWKRRNIENYLLVPDVWKKAVLDRLNVTEFDIFSMPIAQVIDTFFEEQNLTLPRGKTWNNLNANIFQMVDGKKILFENPDSLFHRLNNKFNLKINREVLSANFTKELFHQDILHLFDKLDRL
jgi:hypothetical protein